MAALLDKAELTAALEAAWRAVRRLNRYVEEQAPWSLAKAGDDEAVARVLATLVEGLRVIAVLLHPLDAGIDGEDRATPSARLTWTTRSDAAPAGRTSDGVERIPPLFPKHDVVGAVIDSHTHLAFAKASDDAVRRPARPASRGCSPWGRRRAARQALDESERFEDVWAAIGRHPNAATDFTDADLDELRELARHPRCAAIGETGLDFYREGAPREDQERAFRAQIELARETGQAPGHPLARRGGRDDRPAVRPRGRHRRDPALLLDARPDRRVPAGAAGGSPTPAT